MSTQAAFTSDAVRDGEPQALAALCVERGSSVLGFCEQVAAPRQAALAAADAFALLRRDLVAASGAPGLDLNPLLQSATRRAAAERGVHAAAPHNVPHGCAGLEPTLVAWLEQPVNREDRRQLDDHIAHCRACTVAMRRLEAGQRAFERPPRARLPLRIAEQIIAALVDAAPVRAAGGDADAVRTQALQHARDLLGESTGPAPAAPAPDAAAAAAADPATSLNVAGAHDAQITPAPEPPAAALPIFTSGPAPAEEASRSVPDAPPAAPRRSARSSADGAPRSSGQRRAPARVAPTLSALIADARAAVRYRILGPAPGSTERPRGRLSGGRRRAGTGGRNGSAAPVDSRSELAAIGLFATVAVTVALVTFLLASTPPQSAASRPDPGLPAGRAGTVQPAPAQTEPISEPSRAPRSTARAGR